MDLVERFDVWIINLDPTMESEVKKTCPCMVVSPNEANKYLKTVIVVPLTSTKKDYPTRLDCYFEDKKGQLVIDQIRAIDKRRLIKKLGKMDQPTSENTCKLLQETFKY